MEFPLLLQVEYNHEKEKYITGWLFDENHVNNMLSQLWTCTAIFYCKMNPMLDWSVAEIDSLSLEFTPKISTISEIVTSNTINQRIFDQMYLLFI